MPNSTVDQRPQPPTQFWNSIKYQLMRITLATTGLAVLFILSFVSYYEYALTRQAVIERSKTIVSIIGHPAAAAVMFKDPSGGNEILKALKYARDVLRAEIYGQDNLPFATYCSIAGEQQAALGIENWEIRQGESRFHHGVYELALSIKQDVKTVGTLFLRMDMSNHYQRLYLYWGLALMAAVASLAAALAMGFALQKKITQPMYHLLETMGRVSSEQDYNVRANEQGCEELSRLITRFNEMLALIQQRDLRLEAAKAESEEASQIKSRFLAIISHEIRTPMNAILGFAEILRTQITHPHQRDYLSAIINSGEALLRLMNDLLDLSKVEAGKLKIQTTETQFSRLCEELRHIFDFRVRAKGLQLHISIDDNVPPSLLLDGVRLRQILLNVVGNAVKFTEHGHIELLARYLPASASAPYAEEPGVLEVRVRDTGIGIPASEFERIFGAFEQRSDQDHATYGGSGLGLAITRRLVELMRGSISLESEEHKGSTFTLRLPALLPSTRVQARLTAAKPRLDTVFVPATILVADDEPLNRKLLRGFLASQPLSILEATNGQEAVTLARKYHPALVLMDMKMPLMGGLEATHILKSDSNTADIPIIAVTALDQQEIPRVLELCDAYLPKPVKKPDLIEFMRRFLPCESPVSPPPQPASAPPPAAETVIPLPDHRAREEINTVLEPAWRALDDTSSINELENFATLAMQSANRIGYAPLEAWAAKLKEQTALFDMDGIPTTLAAFKQFLAARE